MVHGDTEALFPLRVAPALAHLRGGTWQELVAQVQAQPRGAPAQVAFVLMMARLAGCQTCDADAQRAFRGCTDCATTMLKRFRSDDQALVDLFTAAQADVQRYQNAVQTEVK